MPASVLRFCLFFGLVFGIAAWSASPYVQDDADVSEDPNVQGDADVSEDPDVQDYANPNTSDVVDADGCGDAAPCEDGTYCIDEEECIADGQQCTSAEIESLDTFEGDATMVPGACARACDGSGGSCVADCLLEDLGLSNDCGQCFAMSNSCSMVNCPDVCEPGPPSEACTECFAEHCLPARSLCLGTRLPL